MKKIIKRAVSILAGVFIVGLVGTCVMFREEISIMRIQDMILKIEQ